ncbi:unnamed protein product [Eruca vesicaria subsp. sativa]|uniref:Uncharacterized protein n=1 Tax=Eruca vesicaria subsp. sativa TaxID=29727 RepID=A0ABC8JM72_ERUVS|nr:unnamed protein product [Eruca vesicaria subsp. sativa]
MMMISAAAVEQFGPRVEIGPMRFISGLKEHPLTSGFAGDVRDPISNGFEGGVHLCMPGNYFWHKAYGMVHPQKRRRRRESEADPDPDPFVPISAQSYLCLHGMWDLCNWRNDRPHDDIIGCLLPGLSDSHVEPAPLHEICSP